MLTRKQGFDEFLNLVLDDAVVVGQITKTQEEETRKPLGKRLPVMLLSRPSSLPLARGVLTLEQAVSCSRVTTSRSSREFLRRFPVGRAQRRQTSFLSQAKMCQADAKDGWAVVGAQRPSLFERARPAYWHLHWTVRGRCRIA